MKKLLYLFILIIVAGIAFALFLPSYLSTATNSNAIEITVPEGASLSYVSNTLFDKGVIKSKIWFKYKAKEAEIDRKIKPGTYLIPSNSTLENIFYFL